MTGSVERDEQGHFGFAGLFGGEVPDDVHDDGFLSTAVVGAFLDSESVSDGGQAEAGQHGDGLDDPVGLGDVADSDFHVLSVRAGHSVGHIGGRR